MKFDYINNYLFLNFSILFLISSNYISGNNGQEEFDDKLVDIPGWGKTIGNMWQTDKTKRPYIQWFGIKYGKAPFGNLRFKPSELETESPAGVNGTYWAMSPPRPCPQPPPSLAPGQSEDCLGLNIFRPLMTEEDRENNVLYPVIVFVHGGAFQWGFGHMYNAARLLERDVILVTFNYRMGVLGGFNLQIDEAPGNAGIYDAALALEWVKNYIVHFNGDPNIVTFAGQSAGAAIVSHLLASPYSKNNLFQKAIISSGNAINEWSINKDPIPASLQMASLLNCNSKNQSALPDDYDEILDCLYGLSHLDFNDALLEYQREERIQGLMGFNAIIPSLQNPSISNRIIPEIPEEVFKKSEQYNVPVMIGANRHDGSFVLSILYNTFLTPNDYLEDSEFLRNGLVTAIFSVLGVENTIGVYDSISSVYLGESKLSGNFTEMIPGIMDICSVFFFKAGANLIAQYQSKIQKDTYLYSFDYYGLNSLYSLIGGNPDLPSGVAHGDDLLYVFRLDDFNEQDEIISDIMVDYWVNFAITGNPNNYGTEKSVKELFDWPQYSEKNTNFLIYNTTMEYRNDFSALWQGAAYELLEDIPTTEPTAEPTEKQTTPTSPITMTPTTPRTSPTTEINTQEEEDCKETLYRTLFIVFTATTGVLILISFFLFRKVHHIKQNKV